MSKNIASYNQRGGITAEKVNFANQITHKNKVQSNFLKKIGLLISLLGLIVAALTYFGIRF